MLGGFFIGEKCAQKNLPFPPCGVKKKACGFLRTRSSPSDFQLPKLDQLDNRLRATFDIQLLHDVRDVFSSTHS